LKYTLPEEITRNRTKAPIQNFIKIRISDFFVFGQEKIFDAEVLESSTFDENIIIKILIKAGRTIAKPALEVLEMALDPYTPAQVRVSLMAALAYLIMPFDLFPDFMPLVGFSDDFVALTAVLSIWSKYMTPSIRVRAENKLNKLFPFFE